MFRLQFCQPLGWALSNERLEPRFFVSVLTDIDANRHYCACLCFNETVAITPNKPIDEEEDDNLLASGRSILSPAAVIAAAGGAAATNSSLPVAVAAVVTTSTGLANASSMTSNITHHSIMYAPKCLVLVSRLDYTETFRVSSQRHMQHDAIQFAIINRFFFFIAFHGNLLQNCLGTIYTVFIESFNYPLETLIGNILGCIQVQTYTSQFNGPKWKARKY